MWKTIVKKEILENILTYRFPLFGLIAMLLIPLGMYVNQLDYARKKIVELQAKDPTVDWWNTAVDMSDRPRFEYREEALGGRVQAALPTFLLLLGYGLVFFVLAYISFLKYDVR